MDHDDSFANVSWQSDPNAPPAPKPATSPRMEPQETPQNGKRHDSGGQLGHNALDLDLAGVGDAVLECTVTSPIKENDGSKDAYVSYLVTTNVCFCISCLILLWARSSAGDERCEDCSNDNYRQISPASKSPPQQCEDVLRTSCFYTKPSQESTPPALFPHSPINTNSNMFAATASALTSPLDEPTLYTAS